MTENSRYGNRLVRARYFARGRNYYYRDSKAPTLLLLAKILPWQTLMHLVVEEHKQTSANGQWWMGRKIKVRMHLGAYLLQRLYTLTDRKIEYQIWDNAAFRLFCGWGFVDSWHDPDHTKIEDFRNSEGTLETAAAEKGYWSAKNRKTLQRHGICTEGLQQREIPPRCARQDTALELSRQAPN